MNMGRMQDKVVVVTASTAGIGLAIARKAAQEGGQVVISSRKQSNVDEVVAQLEGEGLQVKGIKCHVGLPEDRELLVKSTVKWFGRIDALVSNAAVNPAIGSLAQISESAIDKILDINLKAAIALAKAVVPYMPSTGSILLVSSIAGYNVEAPLAMYGISKTALFGLTRALALELGRKGIRVNCVAPGVIPTKLSEALVASPQLRKKTEESTMLGRLGTPEEVANVVVFLVSDEASYITAEIVTVAGGMLASKL